MQLLKSILILLIFTSTLSAKESYEAIVYAYKDGKSYFRGTGVLIQNNLVVTNEHIVRGADELVQVSFFPFCQERHSVKGKIVKINEDDDLALIRIEPVEHKSIPIAKEPSQVGDIVTGSGYAEDYVVVSGKILAKTYVKRKSRQSGYHIMCLIQYGMSGGPVINNQGELAGILFSFNAHTPESYFVGSEAVLEFLEDTEYGEKP